MVQWPQKSFLRPEMARKLTHDPKVVFTTWKWLYDHFKFPSTSLSQWYFFWIWISCPFFYPNESCSGIGLYWSSSEVLWSIKHLIAADNIVYVMQVLLKFNLRSPKTPKSWDHALSVIKHKTAHRHGPTTKHSPIVIHKHATAQKHASTIRHSLY